MHFSSTGLLTNELTDWPTTTTNASGLLLADATNTRALGVGIEGDVLVHKARID
jgi:hypothetical protein